MICDGIIYGAMDKKEYTQTHIYMHIVHALFDNK